MILLESTVVELSLKFNPSHEGELHMSIQPFKIAIPQATLDDLHKRLAHTRWPDEIEGAAGSYGTDLAYMRELVDDWQKEYDWRKHEAALNQFAHFKTDVNGVNVHFIHERGKGPNPTPILLLHGWPDSFYRYHKVIARLADPVGFGGDPNPSFDVIVPSIPGFGFSERKALNDDATASLFATLMHDVLGYKQFVAAGGDLGANVIRSLALSRPELLIGIHLSDVGYPDQNTDFAALTPPEQGFAGFIQQWWMKEGAFNMIQSTKPQTLSYGLTDSPAGMAAWMLTLLGGIQNKDEQLTNMTIYWVTQTIGSSIRGYYENAHSTLLHASNQRSTVPAGVIRAPWDAPFPREWAARRVNLVHFTDFPRGGHFLAWEEPELFVKDVQQFIGKLRK
jgi:pimeloyl-ACP methyl ester carboxylesterase